MQTTEQGDGRFFHEGASSVYQYTDTEPACLVWETPSPSAKTPQASLCLWRRGLLLEQSSPQMGLSTPKGAPQLGSYLICYEPLSIIRVLGRSPVSFDSVSRSARVSSVTATLSARQDSGVCTISHPRTGSQAATPDVSVPMRNRQRAHAFGVVSEHRHTLGQGPKHQRRCGVRLCRHHSQQRTSGPHAVVLAGQ